MMTQGHLKTRFCMQKLLEIGRLLFSNFSVCFNFFATYYNLPLLLIFAWNFDLLGDLVIIYVRKISFCRQFLPETAHLFLFNNFVCSNFLQLFVARSPKNLILYAKNVSKFAGCSSIINFVCSSFLQFNID